MIDFNKLLLGLTVLVGCALPVIRVAAETPANSIHLKNTHVTPHLRATIEPGRNIVFCSTFQITWNLMKSDIIKEDIQLEKPLHLVRFLNHGLTTKEDISQDDYLAMVGYGAEDIADTINLALRRKFGSDAPVVDDKYNEDDTILAYAFLMKELLFENAFEDFKDPMTFYGNTDEARVQAFGIFKCSGQRYRRLRDQVEIIDYTNYNNFIIRLKSKHPDDEIILAYVEPEMTLLETFEKVNCRIAQCRQDSKTESIGENDILQIPKFDLSIDHSYESLLGLYLLNKGFEDYFVAEARQDIRFRLDECGATAKSKAVFALKKGPPIDFRVLIFNNPFMLYLKKKDGQYPYLALWVENADLMVESDGLW